MSPRSSFPQFLLLLLLVFTAIPARAYPIPGSAMVSAHSPSEARPGGPDAGFDPAVLGRTITYPVDAILSGRQGSVLMRVLVLTDGSVSRIEWRQGDDTVLASSAFRALIDFRFTPSGRDSERGESWIYIPIRFAFTSDGPRTDSVGRPIVTVTPRIARASGAPELTAESIQGSRGRRKGGRDTVFPTLSMNALRKNLYYPDMARFNRFEGTVIVYALVGRNGRVSNAHAVVSDNGIFDEPAVDAVRRTSFTPGTVKGKPADVWTLIPVDFRLNAR